MDFMMEFLETLGTVAFSISGAIEAMKKQMDLLGVLVLGLVTAVGGRTDAGYFCGGCPLYFSETYLCDCFPFWRGSIFDSGTDAAGTSGRTVAGRIIRDGTGYPHSYAGSTF